MRKRVVVTGLGVVASNGTGIDKFLKAIKEGQSGIKFLPELEELNFACQIGGIPDISQTEAQDFFDKYQFTDSGDNVKYSSLAAAEAWKDAGFEIPDPIESETDYDNGVIIGGGVGNIDIFSDKIFPMISEGKVRRLRSNIAEFTMFSAASANISFLLALGNQVSANSSACSTGAESIILGAERIRNGHAKRMIVGSSEIASPYVWGCFDSMRVLCRVYNDTPQQASRPMSSTAAGFVPAAGAGVLLLEDYETAVARNAKIYAEIIGTSLNSGGQRKDGSMQAPGYEGVQRCLKDCIKDADISPNEIDAICGHLSSTMADSREIKNWAESLNRYGDDFPYINSLKSITGHSLGASGTIETIAAILEMHYKFLFPSINCEEINPEIEKLISKDKIPHQLIENIELNTVAKASFGFGDINSCLILKKLK
ncbi:MAG: beta-ketoacyl-ACP synthase [Marinilabiliales bacterium]|nr:MAG: beta-ketoacyl-ACP synthase [Marinilabiliales bacterium]